MLKKKAMIKMIDTYIRQLNEIREDINSMITEDTSDLSTCSNEGAAKYIVAMLKDRSDADIQEIFKEVELRLELLDRNVELKSTKVHNRMSISDLEEILIDRGYKFIKRKDDDETTWLCIIDSNSNERIGFCFDKDNLLYGFGTSDVVGYRTK